MEFYEFHDFRDSVVEYLTFHFFRDSGVEFYEFHYFYDSVRNNQISNLFFNSGVEF